LASVDLWDAASRFTEVAGCQVHWRTRGRSRRGLVLIHGGAAHSHWWDAVVPAVETNRRTVAIDLSGHGRSGWRSRYEAGLWVREVSNVVKAAHLDHIVLVAHSMGGRVAVAAAAAMGTRVEQLILIDVPLHLYSPGNDAPHVRTERTRRFESRADALAAFRLIPHQSANRPELVRLIAARSVVKRRTYWTYRADTRALHQIPDNLVARCLSFVTCPVVFIRAAQSTVVNPESIALLEHSPGFRPPVEMIAGAGHHATLDEPLAVAAAINSRLVA
jgi:pimeloyl-ACP methyl ester carboxylesterase